LTDFDNFQRLDRLIDTDPTAHERYMRLAVRMGISIDAARNLIYRGKAEGNWLLDPTQRRGTTQYTIGDAFYVEVPFWPNVPKITKKGMPPSHCLYQVPGKHKPRTRTLYGPYRLLFIAGERVYLDWSQAKAIMMICEVAFYCPAVSRQQVESFARILRGYEERVAEQAQANAFNETFFPVVAAEAYKIWVEGYLRRNEADASDEEDEEDDQYEPEEGEAANRLDESTTREGIAGRLADFVAKTMVEMAAPRLIARDKIFLKTVDMLKQSAEAEIENMQVGMMRRVFEEYGEDARDFIAARMRHHLLEGSVQPMLPIPPPTDTHDFGPHRATQFTPNPPKQPKPPRQPPRRR